MDGSGVACRVLVYGTCVRRWLSRCYARASIAAVGRKVGENEGMPARRSCRRERERKSTLQ